MTTPDAGGPASRAGRGAPPASGPAGHHGVRSSPPATYPGLPPGPAPSYRGLPPGPPPSWPGLRVTQRSPGSAWPVAGSASPAAGSPWPAPAGRPPYGPLEPPRAPRLREDSRLVDLLVAGGLLVTFGFLSLVLGVGYGGVSSWASALASIVMPVALYWRRTHPVASAVVVYAMALTHYALGAPLLFVDVLVLVALYSVTAHGPVWAGRLALAGSLFGALLQAVTTTGTPGPGYDSTGIDWYLVRQSLDALIFAAGLIGALCMLSWALGLLRRSRLAHTETLAERAKRLEIERDQQAQIATAAERSRIAREMHDIVAHSLSVVIAQADGGRYAAAQDPQAAVRSLTTIAETGRAALADMRKILGVLRAPGTDEQPQDTAPQPISEDLETLVDHVRDSGLEVSLIRVGDQRPLPPGLSLTLYRICQEALTNVLKHAGPSATATVLLQWSQQRIVLQVDDTGRGAAAAQDGGGHGLVGMQERVNLFGGTLEAGAKTGGGFRVRAEIPLPGTPAADSPIGIGSGSPAPLAPASWPTHPQNGAP